MMLQLTRSDYRNRIAGAWLGKLIGGTLGAPLEGSNEIHALSFYEPVPGQAAATDGLDYALVWLKAARDKGPDLSAEDLAIYRDKHLSYVWDEYGYAAYNRRRGLAPPLTGSFDNWFKHGARGLARC